MVTMNMGSMEAILYSPNFSPLRIVMGGRKKEIKIALGVVTPGMSRRSHKARNRRKDAWLRWDLRKDMKMCSTYVVAKSMARSDRGGEGINRGDLDKEGCKK